MRPDSGPLDRVSIRLRSLVPRDSTLAVAPAVPSTTMPTPLVRGVIATRPEGAETSAAVPVEVMLSWLARNWIAAGAMVPSSTGTGLASSEPSAVIVPPARVTAPLTMVIPGADSAIPPGTTPAAWAVSVPATSSDCALASSRLLMTRLPRADRPALVLTVVPVTPSNQVRRRVEDARAPCDDTAPSTEMSLSPLRMKLPAVEVPITVSTSSAPDPTSRMSRLPYSAAVRATRFSDRAVLIVMLPAVTRPALITVPALST